MSGEGRGEDYLCKYAELDALVRKHASHSDRKRKSVESQLRDSLYENQVLREKVAMLMELRNREHETANQAQRAHEKAMVAERTELHERQQLLLSEEKSYESRLRHLEERETQLNDFEAQLRTLQEELNAKESRLAARQEQYERGVTVMQTELEEEQQRVAAASAEVEEKLLEARHAALAAQQRKRDLDHLYAFEQRYLSLVATEMHDRMCICNEEADFRGALLSCAFGSLWSAALEESAASQASTKDLWTKAELLELKGCEMRAKLYRERDLLKDDRERFLLEKETFVLDCQAISRNIRAALPDTARSATAQGCLAALERAETMLTVAANPPTSLAELYEHAQE